MTASFLPPPIPISDTKSLKRACESFHQADKLAVDTEANSLYAYQTQVCLIQCSTADEDFLIDPLSLDNLDPLGGVFGDPEVEKVFHASEFDINILYDAFGFQFQNLFDTMLAARILGRKSLGLDSLLEEIAGVQSNKRYQRADWGQRPLPEGMIRYAQKDTHYLIEIRNVLAEELRRAGRWDIAQEDFNRACHAYRRPEKDKLPPCWRISGAQDLSPQKAAILEKLCRFRDQVAQEKDQPLFKILNNQTLLALAQAAPPSRRAFDSLPLAGHPQVQRFQDGLWQAIQEGRRADPLHPPQKDRPDDDTLDRLQALKGWRKRKARQVGVNSAVILPRYLVAAVAEANPQTLQELEKILEDVPLRFQHYGEEILATLASVPGS